MPSLLSSASIDAPQLRPETSERLSSAAPGLWRVTDGRGRIIGHLESVGSPPMTRYRARRYHAGSRAFRDLGDFWSADDAVECLRFAR